MSAALSDAVVERARSGDTAALTTIYIAVSPGILAYLRSHVELGHPGALRHG